jgi:hypothetical protein
MDKRIIFSIVLFIIMIIISGIKIENFSVTSINAADDLDNEEYRKCIDESSRLYYKSHGKYPDCATAVHQLADRNFGPNDNVGFGAIKDACPIACLTKAPSDCLEKHILRQNSIMTDINNLITDSTSNEETYRNKINNDVNKLRTFHGNLFSKPEISDAINYIVENQPPIADKVFNKVIKDIQEQNNAPVDEDDYDYDYSDNMTKPAIIFGKDKDMNISKSTRTKPNKLDPYKLLGYNV